MQINYSPLISSKQTSKQKTEPEKSLNLQTNPHVGFAAKTMPAAENLRAYYLVPQNISFGRGEHREYGATVTNNKARFAVYASKADTVELEIRKLNADDPVLKSWWKDTGKSHGEVHFKIDEKEITFKKDRNDNFSIVLPMEKDADDKYSTEINLHELNKTLKEKALISNDIKPAEIMYRYNINNEGAKDPCSESQPFDTLGWSKVVDCYKPLSDSAYEAKKTAATLRTDPVELAKTLADMRIYKIHVGTFTKGGKVEGHSKVDDKPIRYMMDEKDPTKYLLDEKDNKVEAGTYKATKIKLQSLQKQGLLGENTIKNAVELLPIAEFYGYSNMGYDGNDLSAPESSYGSTEDLIDLVKWCKDNKIKIGIDVQLNHAGPIGLIADKFMQFTDPEGKTDWGSLLNYKNPKVEEHMINLMKHLADDIGFDFARYDMSQHIPDDSLRKMFDELNKEYPWFINIMEHGTKYGHGGLEKNITTRREDEPGGQPNGIGADAQWAAFENFENFATGKSSITKLEEQIRSGGAEAYNEWPDTMPNPPIYTNVNYTITHDNMINKDALTLIGKTLLGWLNIYDRLDKDKFLKEAAIKEAEFIEDGVDNIHKFGDFKNRWVGQHSDRAMGELLLVYYGNKDNPAKLKQEFDKVQNNYFTQDKYMTLEYFEGALKEAQAQNRAMTGLVQMMPGAKLAYQGDMEGNVLGTTYMAQYQKESKDLNDKPYALGEICIEAREKGFPTGAAAYEHNILDPKYLDPKMTAFSKALGRIIQENSALRDPNLGTDDFKTFSSAGGDMGQLMIYRKNGNENNEIFAVMNFSDIDIPDYTVKNLPGGSNSWQEILNSDDTEFGGHGKSDVKNSKINSENGEAPIKLPKHSIVIFKKIN